MSFAKKFAVCCTLVGMAVTGAIVGAQALMHRSVAQLNGEHPVAGIERPVEIFRDANGIPTIRAATLRDAFVAQGFVHAQDRSFQMDMYRRIASGRLAEVAGRPAVGTDIGMRRHRFNDVAQGILDRMGPETRAMLDAYSVGVNAGLGALRSHPPEYTLLGTQPEGWSAHDTVLVSLFMQIGLSRVGNHERMMSVLDAAFPAEVVDFLTPRTTRFDVLADGTEADYQPLSIPGPEFFRAVSTDPEVAPASEMLDEAVPGSNNWAVAGWRSVHSGAMVANDMHLGLSVPNIWSRVQLEWTDPDGTERRAAGVSLPGAPGLIVGSNGFVAWGFTNVTGDFIDHVVIEPDEVDPTRYRTPEGTEPFGEHTEIIRVRGGEDVTHTWQSTRWGLVSGEDHEGRELVEVWIAHCPDRNNLRILEMLSARTLEEGLEAVRGWKGPPQNVLLACAEGRIAWMVSGWIPKRIGFDGTRPVSWADPGVGWDGPIDESDRPSIVDPPSGVLMTANARTLPLAESVAVGHNFSLGVRQQRIGTLLAENKQHDERSLLDIALDTRSAVFDPYAEFLRNITRDSDSPMHSLAGRLAEQWNGHADADCRAYFLIRRFRAEVHERVLGPTVRVHNRISIAYSAGWLGTEEVVLRLLEERPEHWLDPRYESWDALLSEALDATITRLRSDFPRTGIQTPWGHANRLRMEHPLSSMTRGLLRGFDMPGDPQPGDALCVRVATPGFGASQRMVVSPGRESEGILHLPGGVSGHPMSAYFRAGHDDWVQGRASPLLAGPPVSRMVLSASP